MVWNPRVAQGIVTIGLPNSKPLKLPKAAMNQWLSVHGVEKNTTNSKFVILVASAYEIQFVQVKL